MEPSIEEQVANHGKRHEDHRDHRHNYVNSKKLWFYWLWFSNRRTKSWPTLWKEIRESEWRWWQAWERQPRSHKGTSTWPSLNWVLTISPRTPMANLNTYNKKNYRSCTKIHDKEHTDLLNNRQQTRQSWHTHATHNARILHQCQNLSELVLMYICIYRPMTHNIPSTQ